VKRYLAQPDFTFPAPLSLRALPDRTGTASQTSTIPKT